MTVAAGLLNVPVSGPEWDRWSFDLDQNIREISAAIREQHGVALPQYQLSPVPFVAITEWLERVSAAVGEVCGALNIQAADVENVDLEDERARQAWVWQVYFEIKSAREALRI